MPDHVESSRLGPFLSSRKWIFANLLFFIGFSLIFFNSQTENFGSSSPNNFFGISWKEHDPFQMTGQDFIAKNCTHTIGFQKMMPSDREGTSAFLNQEGTIDQKDARSRILCSLHQFKKCSSKSIAEQIDLVWAFSPIYSPFPEKMPYLYKTHGNFVGYMNSFGIKSVVLEAIYPGQNFTFTTAGNEPWEIQLEIEDYIYYR